MSFWRFAHICFRSPPWLFGMLYSWSSVGTHYCVLDVNFRMLKSLSLQFGCKGTKFLSFNQIFLLKSTVWQAAYCHCTRWICHFIRRATYLFWWQPLKPMNNVIRYTLKHILVKDTETTEKKSRTTLVMDGTAMSIIGWGLNGNL